MGLSGLLAPYSQNDQMIAGTILKISFSPLQSHKSDWEFSHSWLGQIVMFDWQNTKECWYSEAAMITMPMLRLELILIIRNWIAKGVWCLDQSVEYRRSCAEGLLCWYFEPSLNHTRANPWQSGLLRFGATDTLQRNAVAPSQLSPVHAFLTFYDLQTHTALAALWPKYHAHVIGR